MAQHLCPSCGFNHQSDGAEVPAIEVSEVRPPTLDEVGVFLSNVAGHFGLTADHSVNQVLQALRGQAERDQAAEPPAPSASSCPVCQSLGAGFITTDPDEFNRHMAAGEHPPKAKPPEEPPADPPAPPVPPADPTPDPEPVL